MIILAMVAILAMIAYPSNQNQSRTPRRAYAQADLTQLAQALERVYAESRCYNIRDAGVCGTGGPPFLPALSPMDGGPSGTTSP